MKKSHNLFKYYTLPIVFFHKTKNQSNYYAHRFRDSFFVWWKAKHFGDCLFCEKVFWWLFTSWKNRINYRSYNGQYNQSNPMRNIFIRRKNDPFFRTIRRSIHSCRSIVLSEGPFFRAFLSYYKKVHSFVPFFRTRRSIHSCRSIVLSEGQFFRAVLSYYKKVHSFVPFFRTIRRSIHLCRCIVL